MTRPDELPLDTVALYTTAPFPCSYITGRTARSQVATPGHAIHADVYSDLIVNGFRRSGLYTYRPHCEGCKACIPLRIPVANFVPTRSQRRAVKAHGHLQTRVLKLEFVAEHHALYLHYQHSRHAGGGMDQDNVEQYTEFLLGSHVNSRMVEFREPAEQGKGKTSLGTLRMVSIVDVLNDGLSAVYTYFDPSLVASFGTYSVLWQIARAQQLNLQHVYLGYWVEHSQKMGYKSQFQPHELFIDEVWQLGNSVSNK
jgi:leucyl-tRNA---protein transferase